MRTTLKAFSFFLAGALAFIALVTPASVDAQEAEGAVDISVHHCLALESPTVLTEVGDDCIPGPASFDFYLYGDETDVAVTIPVDDSGVATGSLPVGEYAVHETTTDTALGDMTVSEEGALSIVFGIPRTEEAPEETVTVAVSTYACDGVAEEPTVLGEVGPDCVQFGTDLEFFLWGDGTDDSAVLTTSATEPVSIELPVGGYDIFEVTTGTTVGAQIDAATTSLAIGYPSGNAVDPEPDPETGILNVNTFECESVGAPVVVDAAGDDCTRVSALLTFYLVGDGTDDHVSVTTSAEGAVEISLPFGDYEVIDEATQTTFLVTVGETPSDLNIAYPVDVLPEQPDDPEVPPVTELPETGVGSGSNAGALGAVVGGAILAAGALGVRIRKS